MRRAILGAVIGCVVGLVVGLLVAYTPIVSFPNITYLAAGSKGAFRFLAVIACMTPFTVVGAVAGGTEAILAKLERMSPEPLDKASQILREKQELPDHIQLPTEEEAE